MRIPSSASISVITELKDRRHCSSTGCPALDRKNHLVLGTEFDLCVAFLYSVPTLGLSSPFCTQKDPYVDNRVYPSLQQERNTFLTVRPVSSCSHRSRAPLILSPNPEITGHLLSTLFSAPISHGSVNHIFISFRGQSSSLEAIQLETEAISQTADGEPSLNAARPEVAFSWMLRQNKNPPHMYPIEQHGIFLSDG